MTYVWKDGVSGDWSDASDWRPSVVPRRVTASVMIDAVGMYTVRISSTESYSIGSLELNSANATLSIAGSLTLYGQFNFDGGTISGSGQLNIDRTENTFAGSASNPVTITGGLKVIINGTSTFNHVTIGDAIVTNQFTINETGLVTIGDARGDAATLVNAKPGSGLPGRPDPGGTYVLEGSTGLAAGVTGSSNDTFDNEGTLIKAGGTGNSSIGVNFTGSGTIIVTQGALAFYNTASFSGGIDGPGVLLLQGGQQNSSTISQTLNPGTNLGTDFVIMAGPTAAYGYIPPLAADNLMLSANTNVGCSSVFVEQAEATLTIDAGATLTLTGGPAAHDATLPDGTTLSAGTTTSFAGTITGGGTLALAGGNQSLDSGVTLGGPGVFAPSIIMSGNDTLTVNTQITYAGKFEQGAGTTLAITSGNSLMLAGRADIAGTVNGGGTLSFSGGSQSLDAGASLDVATLTISKPASGAETLTVGASVECSDAFTLSSGTTLNVGATGSLSFTSGATVTLDGATNLASAAVITVGGGQSLNITGTLSIDGISAPSVTKDGAGFPRGGRHHITVKHAVIGPMAKSGATIQARSDQTDGGVGVQATSNALNVTGFLTFSNGGFVSVSNAILSLQGGGASAVSALQVAASGTLNFAGGTFTLRGTASGGTNTLGGHVNLMDGTLELGNSAITFSGRFSQSSHTTLHGSGVLTLQDAVSFTDKSGTAAETGSGTTKLRASTTVSGNLALDGGRILENTSTLTWKSGDFYLGLNPIGKTVGSGTIMNDAGATFDIESDGVIARGAGTDTFVNAGMLIKSPTAGASTTRTTTIGTSFVNTGVVSVQAGTLDIAGAVSGKAGAIDIAGGMLELDSTLTPQQTVTFTTDGSGLTLTDPSGFSGLISGFGGKDTIDLTGFGFNATKLSYDQTKDVLTVTDGSLQAKLRLFGHYVQAGFEMSKDAVGGTVITYVPPPASQLELASGH